MLLSRLYVGEDGSLMCGEPGFESSAVAGIKLIKFHTSDGFLIDCDLFYKNSSGTLCHGYSKKCKQPYKMD